MKAQRYAGAGAPFECVSTLAAQLFIIIAAVLPPMAAFAQPSFQREPGNLNVKPKLLKNVGIDQHLNAQVPSNLVFQDAYGRKVTLGQFFDGRRPVILSLNYYDCPMLCPVEMNNLLATIQKIQLRLGKDYTVVTVSFNPREGPKEAMQKKAHFLAAFPDQKAAESWYFLTGNQQEITLLTRAVGFKYHWDEKTRQYVHPAGLMVLKPDGRISKYFFGIDAKPTDLRLALVDAANGKVGSWTDQVLLFCCTYNPAQGTYQWKIAQALRIGALLIVVTVGVLIFYLFRRERSGESAGGGWTERKPATDN